MGFHSSATRRARFCIAGLALAALSIGARAEPAAAPPCAGVDYNAMILDIIKTLPRGTVDDVRAEVTERIRVLGQNGGYILASSHHIQSDTPLENVFAMYAMDTRASLATAAENPNG